MPFTFERNPIINDVILITPQVFGDERGFFMETYHQKDFENNGIPNIFVQDNHSKSRKGVFRGFHFQKAHSQNKLVRVISGAILDFVIDIRKNSPTYGKYITEVLSAENKKLLFIPVGFAHGFLTLKDDSEFVYKCDDYYSPKDEAGIFYKDPELNIDREGIMEEHDIQELTLSDKDKTHPTLKEFYIDNPF